MHFSTQSSFDHFFLSCIFLAFSFMVITGIILRKKGIDPASDKVATFIILGGGIIVLIPFWITDDMSLGFKLLSSIIALIVGVLNYLGLQNLGSIIGNKIKRD